MSVHNTKILTHNWPGALKAHGEETSTMMSNVFKDYVTYQDTKDVKAAALQKERLDWEKLNYAAEVLAKQSKMEMVAFRN